VNEADASRAGGEAVLSKLSEVLFVETLRTYIAHLPPEQTGWLAGARDPEVGKTLALMHRNPSHPWTLASLAKDVGVSRSVLAERFARMVGCPPMEYLTRWRMQLAARRMLDRPDALSEIATSVGYDSDNGFNRTFRRYFGEPPARWRKQHRARAQTKAAPEGAA